MGRCVDGVFGWVRLNLGKGIIGCSELNHFEACHHKQTGGGNLEAVLLRDAVLYPSNA